MTPSQSNPPPPDRSLPGRPSDLRIGRAHQPSVGAQGYDGLRRLSCAVIIRAIYDLQSPRKHEAWSAYWFLSSGGAPWSTTTGIPGIEAKLVALMDERYAPPPSPSESP